MKSKQENFLEELQDEKPPGLGTVRPPDYAYEALAEVTGTDMNVGRGELNAALKFIHAQSTITDSYLLAAEIHDRAKMYRQVMGDDILLTAPALAKHWQRVAEEAGRRSSHQAPAIAARHCDTCDDHRLVLVETHPVRGSPDEDAVTEAYAPCPDCNLIPPEKLAYRRFDGSLRRGLDSAKVREMMRG